MNLPNLLMPRQDLPKIGVALLMAGTLTVAGHLGAVRFSGHKAGRFLIYEAKGGLSRGARDGWGGSLEGIKHSVPLVLSTRMSPLKIRLIFRRQGDRRQPETVYYKSRLIHRKGDVAFKSKGIIRFKRGQEETVEAVPVFTIPRSGQYILYSQFKDNTGHFFDCEAVAVVRRNVWRMDARVLAGGLALLAAGAGFLIVGQREKNGSKEI